MNSIFRKLSVCGTRQVLNQALTSCRAAPFIRHPVWASVNERQYKGMPTHQIGRWRHLVLKQAPKKKKGMHQMKEIVAETSTAYGTLSVKVSGYDMTVVDHYFQYIHNLCNRLSINVAERYALPTTSTEVMLVPEQGTKLYVDAILKTHERVLQLNTLNAALCPVFMDVVLKNQPEGVQLSVKEHTEADYRARFKTRPELEGLITRMSH